MEQRLNINVSTTDYEKTSRAVSSVLSLAEESVHGSNDYVITDSEFAFGWHFFVVSINMDMIKKMADQMGYDFERLRGRTTEKKFVSWLEQRLEGRASRFKIAIKEEMESSKYGIF